jgi:transposase
MSVPGVGPIVALAFMAVIEGINRFRRMRSVGAYLGLTTRDGERASDHGQETIGGSLPGHSLIAAS